MPAHILVVDDNDHVRRVVREALEIAGHVVAEAANGEQAVASFRQQAVDLVVTDIVMPDKEEIETIMDLRAMSDRVRILAISGGGASSPEVYLKSALALGADRAIAKPFTMVQLVEAVEQLLAQPRPRAETEVEIEL